MKNNSVHAEIFVINFHFRIIILNTNEWHAGHMENFKFQIYILFSDLKIIISVYFV